MAEDVTHSVGLASIMEIAQASRRIRESPLQGSLCRLIGWHLLALGIDKALR